MKNWRLRKWLFSTLSLAAVLAAACSGLLPRSPEAQTSPPAARPPTLTPFQPLPAATQPAPSETPAELATTSVNKPALAPSPTSRTATPAPQLGLWVDPSLPAGLRNAVIPPEEFAFTGQAEGAALKLVVGGEQPDSRWVYALVAPFPDRPDGVSSEELRRAWRGESPAPGPFAGQPLLMEANTREAFAALWGSPGEGAVKVLPAEELLDYAWKQRNAWAIVPFEALEPRWKVLAVDGLSPLHKDFDLAAYPLSLPVSLDGDPALVAAMRAMHGPGTPVPLVPASNRDPNRLTVVAMTGVTALVRATAFTMEQRGVKYPGKDVRDWLRDADLTHISNEVPFAKNCPYPNPVQADMRFCSDPRYIALLEDVGTDIVELTGDHFQDWGTEAMYYTLDLYRERGWSYYGGGANLQEGRKALTIEHNGNRLAFIGCNAKGGGYAQASANHPGAAVCDDKWMQQEIRRLRDEGYLPIATFQHFEYYTYQAQPDQKRDFRMMAKAGAVIVSGSQAHQPQALEFLDGALIHYGLGNLFFDQYDVSLACRQAFIDRHVFYDGRYIGTELLPILFVDYARPRPMKPDERSDLLDAVYRASGWW